MASWQRDYKLKLKEDGPGHDPDGLTGRACDCACCALFVPWEALTCCWALALSGVAFVALLAMVAARL